MNLKIETDSKSDSRRAGPVSRFRLGEIPRQAGMLFSANTSSMVASFLATVVHVRYLEPVDRGRFVFAQTIIAIAGLFLEVGIFPAGARLLAIARERDYERRTLGALVLLGVLLGVILAIFTAAAAYPIDFIFKTDVHWMLIVSAAFAFFLPFQSLVQESGQGLNKIHLLSAFQFSTAALNLLAQFGLAVSGMLSPQSALIAYLASIGIASLWAIARLRPSFTNRSQHIREVLKEVRSYGFNVYLARITGTVSTRMDNLIIPYFLTDLSLLALYDFAQRISTPIMTLSRSLAITRYRAFASLTRVPQRIAKWNTGLLIAASIALVAIGPFALEWLFPKYKDAAPLLIPFATWALFGGLFQPYHMFLASHGRGREIRNIAIIITVADIAGLLLVVPRWGIMGAAWVAAASFVLDYALTLYYYDKFRRTLNTQQSDVQTESGTI